MRNELDSFDQQAASSGNEVIRGLVKGQELGIF
jgi:hypothetical protein